MVEFVANVVRTHAAGVDQAQQIVRVEGLSLQYGPGGPCANLGGLQHCSASHAIVLGSSLTSHSPADAAAPGSVACGGPCSG
jgi:hypothetical protein